MVSPLIGGLISHFIRDKVVGRKVACVAVVIPFVMLTIPLIILLIMACFIHDHDQGKLTAQIERNAEEVVTAPQPQVMVTSSTVLNETRIQISNNSNKEVVTHKSSSTSGGATVNVVVTTDVIVPRRTEPEPKPDPHLPCARSVGIAMVATKTLPPVGVLLVTYEGLGQPRTPSAVSEAPTLTHRSAASHLVAVPAQSSVVVYKLEAVSAVVSGSLPFRFPSVSSIVVVFIRLVAAALRLR
ncbi:hypothetical protein PIB30_018543 [Stylosanthes scabra]|uniref:Uncharacterized protein n=1 Tax=Stylosanthes scabra TaxID=79078 RepID=A0ABU6Z7F3_9FABA|nr:hypothetical protein [Stylosanthes scabra]